MKRLTTISLLSLVLVLPAEAQTEDFVPLFDNDSLNGWVLENTLAENFFLDNGILRVQGEAGWLRSPRQYGEFILRGEVRFVSADADSGIFLRVIPGTDLILGWPGNAYQVQMRDLSVNTSDSPLPLAHVYRHLIADGTTTYNREIAFEQYRGVSQWHQLEVQAFEDRFAVYLNGVQVTYAADIINPTGYIGFQSEAGIIEYRNLTIYER